MNTRTPRTVLKADFAKRLRLVCLFALLMQPLHLYAAQIDVSIVPETVRLNETFQLTFTRNGSSAGRPDFGPLNKDFEVLSQRQSSQSSIVNGLVKQSISWVLKLMPRAQGEGLIPAINFGDEASRPLKIVVEAEQSAAFFLKVGADPKQPYVQSQLIYTWQFYRRADVELRNARLNEPQLSDAVRIQLGDNRQFVTQIEDVEYVVTEGRYAIFPQQSGVLRIPALVLTADVLDDNARNTGSFFRFQGTTTTRRSVSNEIELQVQAVPRAFANVSWLPARQLELSEKWSDKGLQLKVGESLTRTISLRATAVLKSQLPDIEAVTEIEGLTMYADQPLLAEQVFAEGVSALREEKIAIIAARAGQYTLPAIDISWFNTLSGEMEVAHLPSRSLTVVAVSGQDSNIVRPPEAPADSEPKTDVLAMREVSESNQQGQWFWKILSAFLAVGWGLSMVFLWHGKAQKPLIINHQQADGIQAKKLLAEVKVGCRANNAASTRRALLGWCRQRYQLDTLSALTPYCSAELRVQISLLEQSLYSSAGNNWTGDELWRALQTGLSKPVEAMDRVGPLAPLYPPAT